MTSVNPFDDPNVDLENMSAEDFAAFFNAELNETDIKEGKVVAGKVINITHDSVVVDINYKSEGAIPAHEFRETGVSVGDTIDVFIEKLEGKDGQVSLSKERADLMKAWDEISQAVEADEVVEGVIIARVKGGLAVDIGVKAFLPGSQVDLRPVKNLDKLIGTKAQFKIIKFNKRRGNIVLSRRVLLEEERAERRKETLKKIEVGALIDGTVKNITDYGAFIDLGGIDGLLHITDMSWGRVNHPTEMFSIGDEVTVRILKFDPDTQRVSLGYKQVRADPWETVDIKYPIGSVVEGGVVSMADYGVFVELEEGIEGLVHISEMTWNKRIKHPNKLVEIGDRVQAVVLDLDLEAKRISLGMKQLEENPWDVVEQRYPVGAIIEGQVRNITDFGIFVGIDDGIDGLVHISDMSWGQRLGHPSEYFKKGQTVRAKVINIDKENERFSLSIKHLTEDPWRSASERYFLGMAVAGKIVHVADFGVFVELEPGVEGLIHVSELRNVGGDWQSAYIAGAAINAEIISIDGHDRKIGLSELEEGQVGEQVRPGAGVGAQGSTLADIRGAELLARLARTEE